MRLTSVAIRNHTRVADLYIEVRRHLVLVGTNDSGKTSILRCLDLLLGASQGALYTSITADDVRDRTQPFVIEAQLECAANDPHFGRAVRQSGGASTLTLRLEARVEADGESLVIRRYAAGAWHETDLLQSQIDAIGWTYIADDQSFGRAHQSFIDGVLAAQDLQQERKALAEVDRAYARVLEESQPLLELRRRIAAQLTAALPGDYQQNNLVFVPAARDSSSPLAGLRLQLRKNGEQRDLGDQSGGLRAHHRPGRAGSASAPHEPAQSRASARVRRQPEDHRHAFAGHHRRVRARPDCGDALRWPSGAAAA